MTSCPRRARQALSALPLRVRLVAGFAAAVTVVLVVAGAFVYWRVEYALDRRLDGDLRADSRAVAAALGQQPTGPAGAAGGTAAGRRYQLLDEQGRVLGSGSDVGTAPLLHPGQARRALAGPLVADIGALLPVSRRPLRLLAGPVTVAGQRRVLVVADRRDQRDEALRELLAQLAAAGLAALVVTAVVGDRLARSALAPVERYRVQAATIAAGATGIRLDVPPSRDDEVTRLGHTLNEVLTALERAVERERQFTQDASHELRTPLTLLSGRIQLALRRPRGVPEHEQVLRELAVDVTSLTALAEGLLALTTSGSRAAARGDDSDLAAVARAVVAARPARVGVLDVPDIPVLVGLPEAALRQVLTNLIDNAVVHGGNDTGAVHVEVDAAGSGPAVLRVTDAGPGVDPQFLPGAAERFARADVARARPGAGLGLALVRALTDDAGGELRLCSGGAHHRYQQRFDVPCAHPDAGTTATVLLPLGDEPARPTTADARALLLRSR